MAGYSATPLPRKLGIKDASSVALVDPPVGFIATLGDLPAGVHLVEPPAAAIDVIVCFITTLEALTDRFAELRPLLSYTGGPWVAWPKKQRGAPMSVNETAFGKSASPPASWITKYAP